MRICLRILAIISILFVVPTSTGDILRPGDDAAPDLCLSQHIRGATIPVPIYYNRNVTGDLWFQVGPFDLHQPVVVETGQCRRPGRPVVTASAGN